MSLPHLKQLLVKVKKQLHIGSFLWFDVKFLTGPLQSPCEDDIFYSCLLIKLRFRKAKKLAH